MFDDPRAQFFENVLPAYSAFIESLKSDVSGLSRDLRLGKDAALALFHLREHVPWAKGKPWPAFLKACPDYGLLQDIVNVFKHGARHNGQIAKPTDIFETVVLTEYEDAEGTYHSAEKEVTIHLRDGSRRDMKTVLTAVLTMWVTEFKAQGLLQRFELPKPEPHVIPARCTANGGAPLNLEMRQGLRFRQVYRLQKFNTETGKIEAVDITGHNYTFSIYKAPPVNLDISLTNNETGEKIEGTVQLSPDETLQYDGLNTDEERETFGAAIARKYAAQLLCRQID